MSAGFSLSGFSLAIAGLRLDVTADDDLPIAPEGSARKFVVEPDGSPPTARLHARWGDPRVPDAPVGFDSGKGLWRLYHTANGPEIVFTSPMLGEAPYQTASFSDDFRRGLVTLRRAPFADRGAIYPLHYPLDEVFMVHLLARGLGVELHGAAVVLPDGRGWLFVGESGAGKTTLARLWRVAPGMTVLSDERVVVRADDEGGLSLYGTPWHGDGHIAEPGRARLDRVFFLRHGERNALTPVEGGAAVARLFACGFTPFHDAAGLDFSLELLGRVVRACRCAELSFVPRADVVPFLLGS
ncbi:MAG TPA: hypothetical protein VHJ20_14090 [Polyangia bacterium]|nr:hypothetical protein [Polyangia bacterium]